MKIAIVGSHPETWDKAPFDDLSWTIWGFSRRNYGKLPRCDTWFELHDQKHFHSYDINCKGYVEWLKNYPNRMTAPLFPWKPLKERFGPYFLSQGQISWLMAYAIVQEPEEIGLWGVEAAEKYRPQRYEIWHFAQVAEDLGITVRAPEVDLFEPDRVYAFS